MHEGGSLARSLVGITGDRCRLGEAVGLQWRDVDLTVGTVTITRSLTWVGKTAVEGSPKTHSGIRTLTLPTFTIEALKRLQARQISDVEAGARGSDCLTESHPHPGIVETLSIAPVGK